MDQHIKKVYVPMTETAFFILLCLRKPNHGYGIVQMVEKMTDGAIKLTPGTMYGSLSKMEKDNVIRFVCEEDKRKIYQITDLGCHLKILVNPSGLAAFYALIERKSVLFEILDLKARRFRGIFAQFRRSKAVALRE